MKRFLGPQAELIYAALRIVVGLLFALHGTQKLFDWPLAGPGAGMTTQLWIGASIELVCGLMIAVGLLTSWAAFVASGEMAVAYVQFHWKLAFDVNFFPSANKGELALVYCFVFLYIAAMGGGRYSVDARRKA